MRHLVVSFALIGLLVACKADKPKQQPQAGSATGSGSAEAAGSGSGVTAGSGDGPAITLPKGPGTPPTKTTKALDKADFQRLAAIDYPGFKKDVIGSERNLEVRHTTPRPMLSTTVTIAPCFDCTAMDLPSWKAREESLKLLLPEELRTREDTIWELGQTEAAGVPVIFTYMFGMYSGTDEVSGPVGAFSNAYAVYFNDGINQIRVVAYYKDDPATREDMLAMAPRQDLERLAKAFFDAYTHAW